MAYQNAYKTMKEKHSEEVNAFPISFAFSDQQFKEGMANLGLAPTETDKICSLNGTGGFIRRSDSTALNEMFERHGKERTEAIAADKTGEGFIFDMFNYELANYEYGYTGHTSEALEALGLTMNDVNNDPRLSRGFKAACKRQNQ